MSILAAVADVLTTPVIAQAIGRMTDAMGAIRDQLNDADSRLGDGDTGMTVARMVEAVQGIARTLPPDVSVALAQCGRECSRASGSSLGAVTAMALSAAARAVRGQERVDVAGTTAMLTAATEVIQNRSGASAGDKTMLDSLLAIRDAIAGRDATAPLGVVALDASSASLEQFRPREARVGRARMYGVKSVGLDDPGMLAVYLVLRAAVDTGSA